MASDQLEVRQQCLGERIPTHHRCCVGAKGPTPAGRRRRWFGFKTCATSDARTYTRNMSRALPTEPKLSGRKHVRMGASGVHRSTDMGSLAAFSLLKTEADAIRRTGVALVAKDKALHDKLLHAYLSGTAARAHKDQDGAEHVEANLKEMAQEPDKLKKDAAETGTVALQFDKETALQLYCNIVSSLKTGDKARDGDPKFYLDVAAGPATVVKSGGFQELYTCINVPVQHFNKAEQDRCIYALKSSIFNQIGGSAGKALISKASEEVKKYYDQSCTLSVVHVLFQWNQHAFFTYHPDTDGKVSVIINLAPGESSMHVAGYKTATYNGMGSAHLFPGKLYHRSGPAARRCIKVALFFDLIAKDAAVDVDKGDGSGKNAASGSGSASGTVKDEPTEEEPVKAEPEQEESEPEQSEHDDDGEVIQAAKRVKKLQGMGIKK